MHRKKETTVQESIRRLLGKKNFLSFDTLHERTNDGRFSLP